MKRQYRKETAVTANNSRPHSLCNFLTPTNYMSMCCVASWREIYDSLTGSSSFRFSSVTASAGAAGDSSFSSSCPFSSCFSSSAAGEAAAGEAASGRAPYSMTPSVASSLPPPSLAISFLALAMFYRSTSSADRFTICKVSKY